jgi:hypothetical protein
MLLLLLLLLLCILSANVPSVPPCYLYLSGGNLGAGSRRTYVVAFRTADTVQRERRAGFTHSHNDEVNWDKFNAW